jgi:hypothetical protein
MLNNWNLYGGSSQCVRKTHIENNWDLQVKRLVFRQPQEDQAGCIARLARLARLALRRQFKKTIRIHKAHVVRELTLALSEANADLVRMNQGKYTDTEKQVVALKIRALQQHRNGLTPTNINPAESLARVDPDQLYYGQWDDDIRQIGGCPGSYIWYIGKRGGYREIIDNRSAVRRQQLADTTGYMLIRHTANSANISRRCYHLASYFLLYTSFCYMDPKKAVAASRIRALQAHRKPTRLDSVASLDELDEPQQYYGDWDEEMRRQWWLAKFNEDTFVNWLWSYSGVLHFPGLFKVKFAYICDTIATYIVAPMMIQNTLASLYGNQQVRASVDLGDHRNLSSSLCKDFFAGHYDDLLNLSLVNSFLKPLKRRRRETDARYSVRSWTCCQADQEA